ncbi:MAG TPA: RDD family protein [Methanoregula sp.]|nr:RDD family protein [Methanoregula sp.]
MTEDAMATPAPAGDPPATRSPETPESAITVQGRTLYLAKWTTRFWAWIIDFFMVILFLNIIRGIVDSLGWTIPLYIDPWHWEPFEFAFQTLFFFLYWTIMEGFQGRGQSIGKMVMNLKVVSRDGTRIDFREAAIESFGKAFLLPLDCLIGWLAMPETKLRVFNRLSGTIVIKTDYKEPDGILYVKDKE